MSHWQLRRAARKGTATIEVAFVLPVFLVFIFGLIEFGHAVMVNNILKNACRTAARYGSTGGVSSQDVQNTVEQILSSAIDTSTVIMIVKDAGVYDEGGALPQSPEDFNLLPDIEVSEAEPRQLFLVRASVSYGDVALLPLQFMNNIPLVGQAVTRHE